MTHRFVVQSFVKSFLFVFACGTAGLLADAPERIHPSRPVGVVDTHPRSRAVLPEATVKISGLKAVMLGGNVDGPSGSTTRSYAQYLKNVASVLRSRGVQVTEIYAPTSMDTIRNAVKGAHFIAYAGHGIGDSNAPSYKAKLSPAGMLVVNEVWIGESDVRSWEPAPGAIVLYMGACFTAGNAGTDMGKVSEEEAKRRIAAYSKPFMDAKFSGYYAAWWDSPIQAVIAQAFAGKTLGEAYDLSGGTQGVTKIRHPDASDRDMWYHKDRRAEGTVFDYAFVGTGSGRLESLFKKGASNDNNVDPSDNRPAKIDASQNRPMLDALYSGNDERAKKALMAGADPNAQFDGWPALHLAVYFDRRAVVPLLLERKANVNFEIDGYNALALAEAYERAEIADMLKKAGATKSRAFRAAKKPAVRK
ncbi:MAG: ankyrin repeat domain-containing protein [Spirochaetia bacterium]|nr:ankyrin repeat domain-containing protein [Spirochaetia bacterium]